jgi:hypothetical protein
MNKTSVNNLPSKYFISTVHKSTYHATELSRKLETHANNEKLSWRKLRQMIEFKSFFPHKTSLVKAKEPKKFKFVLKWNSYHICKAWNEEILNYEYCCFFFEYEKFRAHMKLMCVEQVMKLTCLKLYPHECEVGKHKYELQIRILSEAKAYLNYGFFRKINWRKHFWLESH